MKSWTRYALAIVLLLITPGVAVAQKRCVKGIPCGNTCIAANKTCRIGSGSATSARNPSPTKASSAPANARYVASSRGRVYYAITCSGWKDLAASNRIWFDSAAEAEARGYTPSTQSGCGRQTNEPREPSESAKTAGTAAIVPLRSSANAVPEPQAYDVRIDALCRVSRVIDAKSIDCSDGARLRLALVETPPVGGPFDELVRMQLEELLPVGTNVPIEFAGDAGDRRLAYFYLPDGRFINEELVRRGLAIVTSEPGAAKHADRLMRAADGARDQSRGLWALGAFTCTAAEHRAVNCTVRQ